MSSVAVTGFMIFILLLLLCMLTIRPVLFDICEIAALHFKFILCDTYE